MATVNAPSQAVDTTIPKLGVDQLLADFGLTSVDELSDEEIFILSMTREMRRYVTALQIPVATRTRQDQKMIRVEREVEEVIEKTTYKDSHEERAIPANDMDVNRIETMDQITSIVPQDILLSDIAPELFAQKLADHELLRRQWREPTKVPITTEHTIKVKKMVEEPAPPEEEKQHAYVLLDASQSMHDDGKWLAARALALEFLRFGYEKRAMMAIRPFGGRPEDASSGRNLEDLRKITTRLLHLQSHGSTDIQQALDAAIKDIKKGGAFDRADILLISDGDGNLEENTLGTVQLHTAIIGNGKYHRSLDDWSATIVHIPGIERLEPPEVLLDEVQKEILYLNQMLMEVLEKKDIARIKKRIKTLQKFFSVWARLGNKKSDPAIGAIDRMESMGSFINQMNMDPESLIQENRKRKASEAQQREQAELAMLDQATNAFADLQQQLKDQQPRLRGLLSRWWGKTRIAWKSLFRGRHGHP